MSHSAREALETLLVRSALDTLTWSEQSFALAGTAAVPTFDRAQDPMTFIATIGFAGEKIRGSVVLITSAAVICAMQPETLRVEASAEPAARDLLGELSNMVLGRLKNNLLKHGVLVLLATPTTTASGRDLVVSAGDGAPRWHALTCGAGTIFLRVAAEFAADVVLDPGSSKAEAPMDEGELTFL
ncbi:MAG: hypothetical protein JWP97_5246 [Labilithrix sp.]|nr:hypothetical protein [Labilithrix sp.]